ncbi:hypothetical protein E0H89_15465 [Acinetobacter sp. ANC 3781]|uniref:hypothetical protein n=1 Tax=Acinetobacter sp. ANC 3781 TaxID=2529835 RepID=UPI0010391B40|nr:hypothetical protein [Acinetobacter sp. ANC 3781]TCB71416.1 hypothetical protein E0H89_15465 [Acinetobacter sp. ANC 3781]
MAERHHGITGRETASGKIPIRDAATAVIAMLAYADDADEEAFPLNTPILVTSINRVLPKAGVTGNLRKNLEIISQITSPTLVVIRIENPYSPSLDQSTVIGTTDEFGQRTGLQALLTVKSVLGITPKIICVPDVETVDVTNAIGAICKKLRAYSYITPRDAEGMIMKSAEAVANFRQMLAFREIEIIWPEFTSGNVFLGSGDSDLEFTDISLQTTPADRSFVTLTYDLYRNGQKVESNQTVGDPEPDSTSGSFINCIETIFQSYPDISIDQGGGGIAHFSTRNGYRILGNKGDLEKESIRLVFKQNPSQEDDLFPMLIDRYSGQPFNSPIELITLGKTMYEGF